MIRELYAFLFEPLLVPVDHRVEKAMALAGLEGRDLGIFYREFQKMDKYHSERVTLPQFYRCIEEKRSRLGDAIFEILQIDYSEGITFGEFLHAIILMCMFESKEVIQLLFFVFDNDKNGFIDGEEIESMIGVFSKISDEKNAIKFNIPPDGKLEFDEMERLIKSHKQVKYATFSMQNKMMSKFNGHSWWRRKKLRLQRLAEQQLSEEFYEQRANDLYEWWRQRKIRKKMGYLKYYLMKWRRVEYDDIFQPKRTQDYAKTNAEGIEFPMMTTNKHGQHDPEPIKEPIIGKNVSRGSRIVHGGRASTEDRNSVAAQSVAEDNPTKFNSADIQEQILNQLSSGKATTSADRKSRMEQRRKRLKKGSIGVILKH